jgi:hypothetical protein
MFVSTDGSVDRGKVVFATSDANGNLTEWERIDAGGNIRSMPGVHRTQVNANSDLCGSIPLVNVATSGPINFSRAYAQPPNVILTPKFDVGAGVRFWATSTAAGFTINTSAPVTGSFAYAVWGAPN